MKTTHTPADLRENITRQAKRLADRLVLPLTIAKEVLAKAPYHCTSWPDLCARLNAQQPDEHVMLLASLPGSDRARSFFAKHIEQLVRSLSQHMLTNANRAGLRETLRHVFGISDEAATLSDIAASVQVSPWRSMGIGPDPNAVIESATVINGVAIRLIGTRVYMPKYFQFGAEVTSPLFLAEPLGKTFRIMWSNPKAWYDAAYAYLTAPDEDDEDIELTLPDEVLDNAMKGHQDWFSRTAEIWGHESSYGDDSEEFMPYLIPHLGCYLVFGVPAVPTIDTGQTLANTLSMPHQADNDDNDIVFVLIDGQPACVEWISVNHTTHKHEGQYEEYFEALRGKLLSYKDCNPDLYHLSGWNSVTGN
jgi:hypothetical protein